MTLLFIPDFCRRIWNPKILEGKRAQIIWRKSILHAQRMERAYFFSIDQSVKMDRVRLFGSVWKIKGWWRQHILESGSAEIVKLLD